MPGVCFSDILRQKDGGKWKRSFKVPEIIQDLAVYGFGEMGFVFPESAQRHICSMRQFKSAEHRIAFGHDPFISEKNACPGLKLVVNRGERGQVFYIRRKTCFLTYMKDIRDTVA